MNDKIINIIRELLKPRTLIAFMLYGTFCYLAIKDVIGKEAVISAVTALMTFFYASKIGQNGNGGTPAA